MTSLPTTAAKIHPRQREPRHPQDAALEALERLLEACPPDQLAALIAALSARLAAEAARGLARPEKEPEAAPESKFRASEAARYHARLDTRPLARHGRIDRGRQRLLTVTEAATFMGVRPKTVYAWVASGRLSCLRAGNRLRFRTSDLERWLGVPERRRNA